MAQTPLDDEQIDRLAYEQAEEHFRLVRNRLSKDAVEALAKEVVVRIAFRLPRNLPPDHAPTEAEIMALCEALLSKDEIAADRIILAARRDGVSPEMLNLGYVAGAARMLGEMWDDDRVSFVEVTIASGRLYRIIRGLRHVVDETVSLPGPDRNVLFALVPDESHTLGIEIATEVFRREGWEAEMLVGETHDAIVAVTQQRRFRSIVLVAHSEHMLANLISLVLAVRITQPLAYVVVAGKIVDVVKDVTTLVGADDVIPDMESAVARLGAIVDMG
ncbi:cobalamin B12-binding domain-containing protein [Cognatiyoonia sp.]|uniref:cobalamin B12-binding domain-containing protein n=1 Tax=Cognatiyoonia sp. TaxID=2211652 RepID=UPI003F6A28A2